MTGGRPRRWTRRRAIARPDVGTIAQRGASTARFRALAAIARVAWSPGSQPVMSSVAQAARQALDAATVSLSVWEPERGRIRCLVNEGRLGPGEVAEPVDEVYALDDYGPLGLLLESQLGWVVDAQTGSPDDPSVRLLNELGKRSGISVPIPGPGRVWGEFYATRGYDQPPFTDVDLEFAVAVAAQVGAAIVTAEHLRRAEEQRHLDPVTGLASRGEVDSRIDAAIASHNHERRPVGLLMVDVVGLRDLVTTDGRSAGDLVVRRAATLVSAVAGQVPGALAGRYDWDRFCVLVQDADVERLGDLAQGLARQGSVTLALPLACGVAATSDVAGPVPTRQRLVRLAEAAQSRARQVDGRVAVVAGRELPAEATTVHAVRDDPPSGPADRRSPRDDVSVLLPLLLDAVDAAGDAPEDRLVALAAQLAHHVDGLGWWVSATDDAVDDPGATIRTVQFERFRLTPTMVPALGSQSWTDDGYRLADYPATAAAVGGGWFVLDVDDPTADPAELAMLDGMGATALLAVGGAEPAGRRWLLELFCDGLTRPLSAAAAAARALVPYALHPTRHAGTETIDAPLAADDRVAVVEH